MLFCEPCTAPFRTQFHVTWTKIHVSRLSHSILPYSSPIWTISRVIRVSALGSLTASPNGYRQCEIVFAPLSSAKVPCPSQRRPNGWHNRPREQMFERIFVPNFAF